MGFFSNVLETAGSLETTAGAADTGNELLNAGAGAAAIGDGLGGMKALGGMGGLGMGLAGIGLGKSIHSIATEGANGENMSDGFFGLAGLTAGASTLAGGAAATVAAPLLTSLGVGGAIGNAGNKYAKEKGYAGKGADGENRTYSEMAADWGIAAKKAGGKGLLGDVLGVGATAGGSLVGGALSIGSFGMMGADALMAPLPGIGLDDGRPTEADAVTNFSDRMQQHHARLSLQYQK